MCAQHGQHSLWEIERTPSKRKPLKFETDSPDARFVAKDHSPNADQVSSVLAERAGAKQGHGPARRRSAILLVGDEAGALGKYGRSLTAWGYAVDLAPDEATAVRLADEKEFDVIVDDIDMRDSSDGESLRRLRERDRLVPVVVLSSGLAFASARAAIDCGAHKYLVKPVSDEHLLEVLVEAIRDDAPRAH
jgi:CheY-like chemotaxis protein